MKKIIVVFGLLLILSVLFTACAPAVAVEEPNGEVPEEVVAAAEAEEPIEVGILEGKELVFVLYSFDGYQQGQGSWFKTLAEAEGATVTLIDGKADPEVQLKAAEDAIAKQPDGIVWHVVRGDAAANAIKAATAANIPVVITGSRPNPRLGATTPFVQLFEYEMAKDGGRQAAQWLMDNKPGEKAKIAYFDRTGIVHCNEYRGDGFIEGVTEVMGEENVEITFRDNVITAQDASMARMEDLLQTSPDFNMFFGCGASQVLGGLAALEAAGRGKAVDGVPVTEFIMSIDGTPDELTKLVDPNSALKATIALTPKENATIHLNTLKRILSGEFKLNDNVVIFAPGELLPEDCESINAYVEGEYSMVQGYEPLDCSKY